MKSILIEKPNQLSIIEREIPTPSAGEVRVKVKLAGICGSDSHIYRGHNPFAKYPRVIGHEFFGVIDAVGEEMCIRDSNHFAFRFVLQNFMRFVDVRMLINQGISRVVPDELNGHI